MINLKKIMLFFSLSFFLSLLAEKVTIGYQGVNNPWKYAIDQGKFEKETGYDIEWRKFESGGEVAPAMASRNVQIAMAGSSPIAAMVSQGIDAQLFWIAEDINAAEALVVRNGAGINTPQDLIGKTIAVPFGSTTHFHLMFALELNKIDPNQVDIKNLQPPTIIAPWNNGDIDAAFIWDPVLANIKKTGKVIITSGELSAQGKATFDGLVVDRKWGQANKKFMAQFVKIIADTDASYRNNPSAWHANSSQVAAIAKLSGAKKADVPATLALYAFPSLEEQASNQWLGGGRKSGAVKALTETSKFLKEQKKISKVQRSYTRYVTDAYVKAAMKLN